MTKDQAEQAVKDAGCGWDQLTNGVVLEVDATTGACNSHFCESLAAAATRSGVTAEDLGTAVRALVDGDDGPLREVLAP